MIKAVFATRSVVAKEVVGSLLAAQSEIVLAAISSTGSNLVQAALGHKPDVILLGVDLVQAEGIEIVERIMIDVPTPTVILADGRDSRQSVVAMQTLRVGALTILDLPAPGPRHGDGALRAKFVSDIKALSGVKVVRRWRRTEPAAPAPVPHAAKSGTRSISVLGIAASTGGPAALQRVLSGLGPAIPVPVLIVQHIASGFIDGFVRWLQQTCGLIVKTAAEGELLAAGTVYVAGDGMHLGVSSAGRIMLSDVPAIGGFKPSASYMFESLAQHFGDRALGVILTGMGRDGTEGLRPLHGAGALVIAQDQASSVVFGMPAAAIESGLVNEVLPLEDIAPRLLEILGAAKRSPGEL